MSSRNEVVLSSGARRTVLEVSDVVARRRLLMSLSTLVKNARPEESRELTGDGPEAREWSISGFTILYFFYPGERRVEVGIIRPAS